MRRAADAIAHATMEVFNHPLTVMVLMLASAGSFIWACIRPSELAWTLFLSILAIALESAILFSHKHHKDQQ